MGMRLLDLSFEAWVAHVFDHPVSEPRWFADPDAPFWIGTSATAIPYVTRLFEDPLPVISRYTDAQLAQGFWYLVSNGASDCMVALSDATVPAAERARCMRSFASVFRRVLAARCTPHLSHLDEPGAGPLNVTCYMWWDLLPFAGAPANPAQRDLDAAALAVMADALGLPIACQESALHGLGHWHAAYPRDVESIVDRFLAAHAHARPELLAYARSARAGCVQ